MLSAAPGCAAGARRWATSAAGGDGAALINRLFGQAPRLAIGRWGRWPFHRTVYLSGQELRSHIHVIGLAGVGKSRLLAGLFLALYRAGLAATVIDPHGDLVRAILDQLVADGIFQSEQGFERLVYLDLPGAERANRYLPLNVLRQRYPPHVLAGQVKEAMHRAWPRLADGVAPMFDVLVQDGVKVLVSNDLPLTALYRLLSDRPFRDALLRRESDPDVVRFFKEQFDRLSLREQVDQAGSALRRAHLLTFSPVLRHSLGQLETALDFRALLEGERSVLINLALADGDARRLLGCLLTVGYEQAALARSELPAGERLASHHLLLDEFAEFTARSEVTLARMLSQTRKYGLFLALAHQTWSQASQWLQGALQNAGIEVTFRLGRADAEQAAGVFARPNPLRVKHVVADPGAERRTHPAYYPLVEQWEGWVQAFQSLPARQAFVRNGQGRVVKIETLPLVDRRSDSAELRRVEDWYMKRYFKRALSNSASAAQAAHQDGVAPLTLRTVRWHALDAPE